MTIQIPRHALIVRSDSFLATNLDDEIVIMDIEGGSYYSLAKTGRRIWQALAIPCSFEDLCNQMVTHYAAPRQVIESEVSHFLEELIKERMVTLR